MNNPVKEKTVVEVGDTTIGVMVAPVLQLNGLIVYPEVEVVNVKRTEEPEQIVSVTEYMKVLKTVLTDTVWVTEPSRTLPASLTVNV